MKSRFLFAAALLFCGSAALANPPRITFLRTMAPPHDLAPAERLAVIYAIGDSNKIEAFVEHFVDLVSRAGVLRIANAVENNHHMLFDDLSLRTVRREHPADAYLGISRFTCTGTERIGQGSETLDSGDRVKRMHHWIDAVCSARIDVLNAEGKRILSYTARGEGTSPRAVSLSDDERDVAFDQAARYAAVSAAEGITPRSVRETIELDESAPSFDDGFSMVTSERLEDARAIWQAAAVRHRTSAPLFFNLGAVSEAMGDMNAARDYYEKAARLSPKERRYSTELRLFRRRNLTLNEKAARRRP
ncbi:MAG TPA: tetratricopeptide repeat protein [Thermoanaerobaculia bacterium]|jgi:tetratricopeptide (TPR) repeat protein|nr:tetratricopeptide repeat protein [Thermoanaerobaculia bacterium]